MVPAPTPPVTSPAARIALTLSLIQQRPATEHTCELCVMALRGADIATLAAADAQMAGG